jgi:hypothetical protein
MKVRLEQDGEVWGTVSEGLFGRLIVRGPHADRIRRDVLGNHRYWDGDRWWRFDNHGLIRSLPARYYGGSKTFGADIDLEHLDWGAITEDNVFDVLPIVYNDDPYCEIVQATWADLLEVNYFYREFTGNSRGSAPPVIFVKDDALPKLSAIW